MARDRRLGRSRPDSHSSHFIRRLGHMGGAEVEASPCSTRMAALWESHRFARRRKTFRSPAGLTDADDDGAWLDFDDGARKVVCPSCGRESFFYCLTEELTASYEVGRGIPESTRPLPDELRAF